MAAGMLTDVAGRVRNVNLPTSRPLLPLFEAIVNCIQAIEDAQEPNGTISITVFRDSTPSAVESDKGVRDVIAFELVDNGIGFDSANFAAFSTSDTTYKAARGGKGIGRFVWLVAFEDVLVESTFREEDKWNRRSFRFVVSGSGVQDETLSASDDTTRATKVRLNGYKEKYRAASPKKLETIGAHIVEHCLEYLIRPNPPHLILIDDSTKERIDLNELFDKEMSQNAKSVPFKVGPAKFQILHVRLYSSHQKEHMLHYCANNRAVKSERLAGRIPDLARKLLDESQREFLYAAYLDGAALDETVTQERTDFAMCSEEGHIFESGVSWSQIRDAASDQIKSYLAPFTKPVKEKKSQRLERFVATSGPMYRPILKYVEKDIALLDPDIDDSELDIRLYKAYHDFQIQLRVEGRELIEAGEVRDDEFVEYAEKYDSYFLKIGDVNKSDLARYVFDRKLVLQFLQKLLGVQSTGKYALEKKVHNLIFPMGKTSEDVLFDNHNLWLLDERLAYHKYLASDKPLRATEPLVNESRKELDLIVFDKACAFVNSTDVPFQTITIVEFKRPMRDGYSSQENPFDQVLNYIDEIKTGRARDSEGRDVPITESVHYYCYVVADKTPSLEQQALRAGLEKTADNQGFFGYNPGYRAYIEFISYSKLLSDAKQRNQVFFEKLGLPASMTPETTDTDATEPEQVGSYSLFRN
jgi:hypothetical protein